MSDAYAHGEDYGFRQVTESRERAVEQLKSRFDPAAPGAAALSEAGSLPASARLSGAAKRRFAKSVLIRVLTNELLRYGIEDDYVENLRSIVKDLPKLIDDLLNSDDWIDDRLSNVVSVCRGFADARV